MILQTPRLVLREFTEKDLDVLAPLLADVEVMRFSLSGPLSKEKTKEYLQKRILDHYAKHGFGLWAVIDKKEQNLVGFVGLIMQNIDGEELIELGYRLDPKHWGQGYAVEAAKAVLGYAFETLKLDRIISIIDPKNVRSVKVAEKAGMHFWKEANYHGIPVHIYVLDKIVVDPYQKNWLKVFEEEKNKLQKAFKDLSIDFYHIGSTSIPGCSAKPIIDILGVTPDVLLVDQYNLEELKYEPMGEFGMKQRRYFRRRFHSPVNLHIFEDTDPEVERHLRFCSYLREHPEKVKEYSSLKESNAKKYPGDIDRYILAKEGFIKNIDNVAAWEASHLLCKRKNNLRKKDWSLEEIKKAIDVNMWLYVTYFSKYVPSIRLIFQPDVTLMQSEMEALNYILSARFSKNNVRQRVSDVLALYKGRKYSWVVTEFDTPSELSSVLESQSDKRREIKGFYLKLDQFTPPSSYSLTFKQAESLEQLRQVAEIDEKPNLDFFEKLYKNAPPVLFRDDACYQMYIGYKDQVAVTRAIIVFHANAAGIYHLATLPSERKKGYGTQLMQYLLQKAKEKGYFLSVLEAAKDTENMHERLGFQECCVIKVF